MKKQYEAPKAEKVEFDYKEMVTASGSQKKESWNCKCKEQPKYFHNWCSCK